MQTPVYGDGFRTVAPTGSVDPEPASSLADRGFAARRNKIFLSLGLLALLIASRLPLTPRYLITFDEINFALAIRHFNPAAHQPQPPGDPLFVGLIKLLSYLTPHVEVVFFLAGVLLSMAALLLLWILGDTLLEPGGGIISVLLLLFNPAFWLSALSNPVRLGYAVGAPAVALCISLAVRRRSNRWFAASFAVLGLAAGFRPSLALQLAPLLLWAAYRLKPGWKTLSAALLLMLGTVVLWLSPLAAATGGWHSYLETLRSYSYAQTRATSPLMGARVGDAANMAWEAIVWSCLGSLAWLWAVPAAWRRKRSFALSADARRLLLWWFLPGLVFYATFHVGDPDHTLEIVPATCLAGAAVLAAFTTNFSIRGRTAAIVCAVLLNVLLFFKPISKTARPSTYRPVGWLSNYMTAVIDTVAGLQRTGRVTVVFEDSITGWRNVSYYLPETLVFVIQGSDHAPPAGWLLYRNHSENWSSADGLIHLPGCGWLAWVDPVNLPKDGSNTPLSSRIYPVSYTRAAAGQSFQYGGYQFITTLEGCPSQP